MMNGTIILGCPRSGTTLLRRLLNAHPDLSCPGETFLFRACSGFLESDDISIGFDYGASGALEGLGYERSDLEERLRIFVTQFYEELAQKEGKKHWIAKTAVDAFYMPTIEKLFAGHVKFIVILRHGLDVVCSMEEFSRDLESYITELHEYIVRYPRYYEAFAHAWADVTMDILDFADRYEDRCHVLKYEDLAAAPDDALAGIMYFLGIDAMQEKADKILGTKNIGGIGDWKSYKKSKVEQGSIGRWESQLSAATVELLAPVVKPALERAGYSVPESGSDEDAKRRQELARMMMQAKT